MSMNILGISAYYHDSAATLIRDGDIAASAQEERFTRKKHDYNFPSNAIDYCLNEGQISIEQLDYVVFYEKTNKITDAHKYNCNHNSFSIIQLYCFYDIITVF